MCEILIIGQGNVGTHLANAFESADFKVTLASSRNSKPFSPSRYDFIILAVRDDAISSLSKDLGNKLRAESEHHDSGTKKTPIIAHTSGSVSLETLKHLLPSATRCGVFYPMQTFTKDIAMRYDDIPFLIEGSDHYTLEMLKSLAGRISENVMEADSSVRADYHIGAVFACNFTNHLCALADEYLKSSGLQFSTLLPLIRQTIAKLNDSSPADVQTGPASRNDMKVIQYHLSKLSCQPKLQKIYSLLTESINEQNSERPVKD